MNTAYKGFRFGVREVVCQPHSAAHSASHSASQSLLDFVVSQLEINSSLELIELGAVYVNDERSLNPARLVQAGDRVRIHSEPRRYAKPSFLKKRIRQETAEWLVIEKPAGLPSAAEVDNFRENLGSYLEEELGLNLYVVNSLDTDSSGLVVLAKSLSSFEKLKSAFRNNQIKRKISAFLAAPLRLGFAEEGLEILSCDPRLAETSLLVEEGVTWSVSGNSIAAHFRVEILLHGLRPEEMRLKLANLKAPILGDQKNGSEFETVFLETGKKSPAYMVTGFIFD